MMRISQDFVDGLRDGTPTNLMVFKHNLAEQLKSLTGFNWVVCIEPPERMRTQVEAGAAWPAIEVARAAREQLVWFEHNAVDCTLAQLVAVIVRSIVDGNENTLGRELLPGATKVCVLRQGSFVMFYQQPNNQVMAKVVYEVQG